MNNTYQKSPKILVITVSSWNRRVGSNTWSTLLQQYGSENVANICIRDEIPDNPVCSRYFNISENRVLKSIIKRNIKTGKETAPSLESAEINEDLSEHNERYKKMKKKRRYSMLMAREIIWKAGKWRTSELDEFLDSFNPDIILHSMEGYIHLNRIILYAIKRTGAAAIGYVWDDNFTYKQSKRIGYKIYRFFQRKSLKKLASQTQEFFAISDMTKREADAFFGINCKILTKPLNSIPCVEYERIEKPINILYTGNLNIGRDQSLLKLTKVVGEKFKEEFVIDVYTQTELSEDKKKLIEESGVCTIHAPIPQSEVLEKQKKADMLLFLEDIDGPNAHTARLSFSTKITDYLSSGKCILAIGCPDTAPMQYFIENNTAIVAASEVEIALKLEEITNDSGLLIKYAENAREIGIKNHSKDRVLSVFAETISSALEDRMQNVNI